MSRPRHSFIARHASALAACSAVVAFGTGDAGVTTPTETGACEADWMLSSIGHYVPDAKRLVVDDEIAGDDGISCRWTDGDTLISFSVEVPRANTPMSIVTHECSPMSTAVTWLTGDSCLRVLGDPAVPTSISDLIWDSSRQVASAFYVGIRPCPTPALPAATTCPYNSVIVQVSIERTNGMTTAGHVLELAVRLVAYL